MQLFIITELHFKNYNESQPKRKKMYQDNVFSLVCGSVSLKLEGNPSVQSIIDFLRVCEVILVSECSVEQVFSQFGNIIGQRRTLLSPQMLHATYMVKSCAREENMKRIKFNSTNE
ncbi:Hypothetical_protein [Hexamita inflata]|uniref:Hypothetical_protein n=1 Tax=Hexamita inflata TaxID=28002 RepID=A0AA86QM97_9EUKA|nr:Hypothetical protein HINF_LOCUS7461 [Hexamita inflata]CAI9956808.1 Hypothetical protein HINF_LOCUS44453 [Hexamita inflata]